MPPEARWAGCEPGSGSPRRLHDHLVRRPLLLSFSKAAFARTMFEAAASARSPGPRCHSSRPRTGSLTPRPQTCQEKLTTALVTTSVFSTMPGHRRRRHVYLDARSWRSLPVTLFVSSVLSPYLAPSPSDASQSNHEPDCQGCLIVGMPQNSGCTLRPDTALRPDGRFA